MFSWWSSKPLPSHSPPSLPVAPPLPALPILPALPLLPSLPSISISTSNFVIIPDAPLRPNEVKYNDFYFEYPKLLHFELLEKYGILLEKKYLKNKFQKALIEQIEDEYFLRLQLRRQKLYSMSLLSNEIFDEYDNRFMLRHHISKAKRYMNIVLEKIPYACIEYLKIKEKKCIHVIYMNEVIYELLSKVSKVSNINMNENMNKKRTLGKIKKCKRNYKKMKTYKKLKGKKLSPINIEFNFSSLDDKCEISKKTDMEMEGNSERNNERNNEGNNEGNSEGNNERNKYKEGYLDIVMGPMFSGKSTSQLLKLSGMADQRFKCLYINSIKDVRNTESKDNYVTTHNSSYSKLSAKIHCLKISDLSDAKVAEYDYIAVDELQFFDNNNTVPTLLEWIKQGKYVLVASLDADCYRRKFGRVFDLIPYADKVQKITAYCDICRDTYGQLKAAPFTARMTTDKMAELVGGHDMYKAMCRKCHDFHLGITTI